jgi:AraC family transcriptional regulator
MFSFLAGVPLSEYIRRRRMTLAAFELQNSEVK